MTFTLPPADGVAAPFASATVRVGKAVNGNAGFESGQEVMNEAARVYTWFWSSGVSYAPDQPWFLRTAELTQAA